MLYKDPNTGGSDVVIDPAHPNVVYASMWESRLDPWEDGNSYEGTHGGLFKSTDGGDTWHQLMKGLPDSVVQINVALAASERNRLYATLSTTKDGDTARGLDWASIDPTMKGEDVVRVLNLVKQQRGVPKFLFCDNGSEFTSQAMDLWASPEWNENRLLAAR